MSVASTTISKASFVLSNHAKLDFLASDAALVKKTRERSLELRGFAVFVALVWGCQLLGASLLGEPDSGRFQAINRQLRWA